MNVSLSDGVCVSSFAFPQLHEMHFGSTSDMFVPEFFGHVGEWNGPWRDDCTAADCPAGVGPTAELRSAPNGNEAAMQFAAVMDGTHGLYYGIHDPLARMKLFVLQAKRGARASMNAVHLPHETTRHVFDDK
eukprot:COSAG06_NODE_41069_length_395_cov_1.050676_1_plen_131_part_11